MATRRAIRIVGVVDDGQEDHAHHGKCGADEYEGHAAAQAAVAAVGESAEERQEEEGEDVVGSHDHAREGLVQVKRVREHEDAVVHLPERADGEEREADKDGPADVEFHEVPPSAGLPCTFDASRVGARRGCSAVGGLAGGAGSAGTRGDGYDVFLAIRRFSSAAVATMLAPASFRRRRAPLVRNPVGNPCFGVSFSPEYML